MKEEDKLLRDVVIEYVNSNWNPDKNILYDFKYELNNNIYTFDMEQDIDTDSYLNANEIYRHLSFFLLKNGIKTKRLEGIGVVLDSSCNINRYEEFKHILNYINPIVCCCVNKEVLKYKCENVDYSEDLWCKNEICELD